MMTRLAGYDAARRIGAVLRSNGVDAPQLDYLIENALRHIACQIHPTGSADLISIRPGRNPNPEFLYPKEAA